MAANTDFERLLEALRNHPVFEEASVTVKDGQIVQVSLTDRHGKRFGAGSVDDAVTLAGWAWAG